MKGKTSTNDRRSAKSDATIKSRRTPRPTPPVAATLATSTATTYTGSSSIQEEATTSSDSVIPPPLSVASRQTNPDAAEKHEARRIARRVKTSLMSDEGTSSTINHQDDQTIDMNVFTPGAYSVPGDKLLESPPSPNAVENIKTNEEQAAFADPMHSPDSLLVAAELVQPVEDEWKRQIEQEVASRLVQRDQCLTVAEVVIDSDIKADDQVQCRQCLWRWKFVLLSLFLCVGGGLVAIILWATGSIEPDSPTLAPTPSPTLDERQQRIMDALLNYSTNLTSVHDTDPNSPQSLALDWLLFNDTNSALRNLNNDSSGPPTMILQRYALAALFFSTNGPQWKNRLSFLTDRHVCEWNVNDDGSQPNNDSLNVFSLSALSNATYGIYCNASSSSTTREPEDVVQQIRLSHNDLVGTIPSELGLLSNLQVVQLENNTLDHDLPTELGMLTALEELILATNLLDGTLPTEWGQCTALTHLQLSTNNLVGMIPAELGQLTLLQQLDLHDNRFTGTLPIEMGGWSALEQLDLYRNYMGGTLPTEMGLLSSLTSLRAQSNAFIGTLPTELGQLTNLEELYIYDNSLSGTIPTELLVDNSNNFTAQLIFDPQNLGIMGGGVGMGGTSSPTGTSAPTDTAVSAAATTATPFTFGLVFLVYHSMGVLLVLAFVRF